MEKRVIWVQIETEADRFDKDGKLHESDIEDILRNPGNYGIVDFCDEGDVEVKTR